MIKKIARIRLVLAAAMVTALSAVGCEREQPIAAPTDAAASFSARGHEVVVMEPVLVQEPGQGSRTEYRPRIVRLTPVRKDEPIDYSDPIFAQNDQR